MFRNLIFKGKIPYFKPVRLILAYLPILSILVFTEHLSYRFFGTYGWWLLIFVIYIRPLSDILPKLKILKTLTILRKELGILAGYFIIAHGIGFFYQKDLPLFSSFVNPKYWNLTNQFGWGMIGLILAIVITVFSNQWGIKVLKKYWKPIQRLTYPLFLASTLHLYFVDDWNKVLLIGILIVFTFLWVLAHKKRVLWK